MQQANVDILRDKFGFDGFKLGQQPVVETLLGGHSCLAIFPTGSGKSLCYQYTALQLDNVTLVVSPLLALMQDQLDFLHSKGIAAAKIDSTNGYEQNKQIMEQVRANQLKILMVSVERFKNERFRQFINGVDVSMLVIDEAHCISEWGHNFRPDYLKLPEYQQQLNIPLVLLLTATATPTVKQDMARKFAIQEQHIVQTGFFRSNLHLAVEAVDEPQKPSRLVAVIGELEGAGIVYVTLQKQAEELANLLSRQGINAKCYHAGLSNEKRLEVQQAFMQNKVDVVVATIAFGMGVDKANIRYVIHFELPKSIESYSQEIGRAGRDGEVANCITLGNLNNLTRLENFVYGDTPELGSIEDVLQRIKDETVDDRWEMQTIPLSNTTNVRQLALKTLLVQLELRQVIVPLFGYFAAIRMRLIKPREEIEDIFSDERQAFVQAVFAHCEHKKVWSVLDQEALSRDYPHPRHRLVNAMEYMHQQGWIELQSQRHTDVYKVHQDQLQQPELAGELFTYFAQRETAEILRIEQMVDFFQTTQCISRRLSLYFGDHSAEQDCGHCSVCLGKPVTFSVRTVDLPTQPEQLNEICINLHQTLMTRTGRGLTAPFFSRFLAGIPSPFLTKIKAKSLKGFGLYADLGYRDLLTISESACAHLNNPNPR